MNTKLPEAIATYFEVSNGASPPGALKPWLTSTAVVRDEGEMHHGYHAIREWLLATRRKYSHHVEPLSLARHAATADVLARVSGTFPGSPVDLRYFFKLDANKITRLEIVP
jgi:hypothetical protein